MFKKYLPLLLIAIVFLAPKAEAAPLFVQSTSTNSTIVGGGATSGTITFASPVTAGDLIAVLVQWASTSNTVTTTTITDSLGNTYFPATTVMNDTATSNHTYSQVWYAPNIAAGTTTVKAAWGNAPLNGVTALAIHEFSGVATSSPVDTSSTSVNSSANASTTWNSGTSTTNYPNDILFGGVSMTASHSVTAGSGYSKRETTGGSFFYGTETRVVSATGTYAATGTFGAADDFAAFMVAFSASSSAPVAPTSTPDALFFAGD